MLKELIFKYIGAWNFLCFGPEGIEFDLTSMSNICVVKGFNYHDINPVTGKPGSNGTGKSCLQDIVCYALFGSISREKTNNFDVIHKQSKKKLKVEIHWDDYKVIRTRKPESLQLWQKVDGKWDEITCGAGMVQTQKKIEDILGMNFKSFVGVTIFDDRNDHAFLETDGPTKRTIVENLLSLERYREYNKVAKSVKSEAEKSIKALVNEYDRAIMDHDGCKARSQQLIIQQQQWRDSQEKKVEAIRSNIEWNKSQMVKTDAGARIDAYNVAQDQIATLRLSINSEIQNREQLVGFIDASKTRREAAVQEASKFRVDAMYIAGEIKTLNKDILSLRSDNDHLRTLQPGVICDHCKGVIDPANAEHVIKENESKVAAKNAEIEVLKVKEAVFKAKEAEAQSRVQSYVDAIEKVKVQEAKIANNVNNNKMSIVKLEAILKPEIDRDTALIEQRIQDLTSQMNHLEEEVKGPSPYDQILKDAFLEVAAKRDRVDSKRKQITDAEGMLPYYKFWVDAFHEDGIRRFVIDGIIPALNSQIEYWLDILIYGNLKLRFDNMLDPTIERVPYDNDPFVYSLMSGGERRRMNLSVIHAFSHIQMLNCGASPSILFLDEVVTNIDTNGKAAAFDMVQELSQTRQVFLTTHDSELLDMLQGCQVVQLERRDGITKRVA